MEMIWHQAVGISINYASQILIILLKKKPIVLFLSKDILQAVGVIINMIGLA
jgi:hypothetical protein